MSSKDDSPQALYDTIIKALPITQMFRRPFTLYLSPDNLSASMAMLERKAKKTGIDFKVPPGIRKRLVMDSPVGISYLKGSSLTKKWREKLLEEVQELGYDVEPHYRGQSITDIKFKLSKEPTAFERLEQLRDEWKQLPVAERPWVRVTRHGGSLRVIDKKLDVVPSSVVNRLDPSIVYATFKNPRKAFEALEELGFTQDFTHVVRGVDPLAPRRRSKSPVDLFAFRIGPKAPPPSVAELIATQAEKEGFTEGFDVETKGERTVVFTPKREESSKAEEIFARLLRKTAPDLREWVQKNKEAVLRVIKEELKD